MFKRSSVLVILLVGIFISFFVSAFEIPPLGDATDWVRDYAGVLSQEEEQRLENKVHATETATNSQIAIVTIKSLQGEDIDELGAKWAEKRGIGYEKLDNGIFVLVAIDDHKWRIDVGYGLEGAVPDITAWHIGDREMVPYFKRDDYGQGLLTVVDSLSGAIAGEYDLKEIQSRKDQGSRGERFFLGLFVLSFLSLFLGSFLRGIVGVEGNKDISIKSGAKDKKEIYVASAGSSVLTILGSIIVGRRGVLYVFPLYFIRKWVMTTDVEVGGGGKQGFGSSSGGGGFSFGGGGFSSFGGGGFGGGGASGGW